MGTGLWPGHSEFWIISGTASIDTKAKLAKDPALLAELGIDVGNKFQPCKQGPILFSC